MNPVSTWKASRKDSPVGSVSADKVCLTRPGAPFGMQLAPTFRGAFVERPSGCALVGTFSAAPYMKWFNNVWLGFVSLCALGTLFEVPMLLVKEPIALVVPVGCLGFVAIGIWGPRVAWSLAGGNIAFFTNVIEDALRDSSTQQADA